MIVGEVPYYDNERHNSITIRQKFVETAMLGILSNSYTMKRIVDTCVENNVTPYEAVSEMAVNHANSLLKALNK